MARTFTTKVERAQRKSPAGRPRGRSVKDTCYACGQTLPASSTPRGGIHKSECGSSSSSSTSRTAKAARPKTNKCQRILAALEIISRDEDIFSEGQVVTERELTLQITHDVNDMGDVLGKSFSRTMRPGLTQLRSLGYISIIRKEKSGWTFKLTSKGTRLVAEKRTAIEASDDWDDLSQSEQQFRFYSEMTRGVRMSVHTRVIELEEQNQERDVDMDAEQGSSDEEEDNEREVSIEIPRAHSLNVDELFSLSPMSSCSSLPDTQWPPSTPEQLPPSSPFLLPSGPSSPSTFSISEPRTPPPGHLEFPSTPELHHFDTSFDNSLDSDPIVLTPLRASGSRVQVVDPDIMDQDADGDDDPRAFGESSNSSSNTSAAAIAELRYRLEAANDNELLLERKLAEQTARSSWLETQTEQLRRDLEAEQTTVSRLRTRLASLYRDVWGYIVGSRAKVRLIEELESSLGEARREQDELLRAKELWTAHKRDLEKEIEIKNTKIGEYERDFETSRRMADAMHEFHRQRSTVISSSS